MIHHIGELTVKTLGDPHLGKTFTNGVPLHRRGERESSQWEDFRENIENVDGIDVHVCMGDLFDKYLVAPEVILGAAAAYQKATVNNPNTEFVILRGNHDASKDAERRSSFDLFKHIVGNLENVQVIDEPDVHEFGETTFGFVPWDPFTPATELVARIESECDAIFGHWDIDSFGQDDNPNLIPLQELTERTDLVLTGHVHTPETRYAKDGTWVKSAEAADLTVHVTGSMQPYTHGEDPDGERYVTLTLDELAQRDDLQDKCVRVKLKPGEELPEDIDCLQLTVKQETEEEQDLEVEMEAFDFQKLFKEAFDTRGVRDEVRTEVWDSYQELRHDQEA